MDKFKMNHAIDILFDVSTSMGTGKNSFLEKAKKIFRDTIYPLIAESQFIGVKLMGPGRDSQGQNLEIKHRSKNEIMSFIENLSICGAEDIACTIEESIRDLNNTTAERKTIIIITDILPGKYNFQNYIQELLAEEGEIIYFSVGDGRVVTIRNGLSFPISITETPMVKNKMTVKYAISFSIAITFTFSLSLYNSFEINQYEVLPSNLNERVSTVEIELKKLASVRGAVNKLKIILNKNKAKIHNLDCDNIELVNGLCSMGIISGEVCINNKELCNE